MSASIASPGTTSDPRPLQDFTSHSENVIRHLLRGGQHEDCEIKNSRREQSTTGVVLSLLYSDRALRFEEGIPREGLPPRLFRQGVSLEREGQQELVRVNLPSPQCFLNGDGDLRRKRLDVGQEPRNDLSVAPNQKFLKIPAHSTGEFRIRLF